DVDEAPKLYRRLHRDETYGVARYRNRLRSQKQRKLPRRDFEFRLRCEDAVDCIDIRRTYRTLSENKFVCPTLEVGAVEWCDESRMGLNFGLEPFCAPEHSSSWGLSLELWNYLHSL